MNAKVDLPWASLISPRRSWSEPYDAAQSVPLTAGSDSPLRGLWMISKRRQKSPPRRACRKPARKVCPCSGVSWSSPGAEGTLDCAQQPRAMRHATQRTDRLSSRVLTQAYLAGAGAAGFAGVVAAGAGVDWGLAAAGAGAVGVATGALGAAVGAAGATTGAVAPAPSAPDPFFLFASAATKPR